MKVTWAIAAAAAACAAMALTGCGRGGAAKAADAGAAQVVEAPDVNILEVEHPEQYKLVTAGQHAVVAELNVNGVITPDVSRSVPVLSLAGGRAIEVRVRLGDYVRAGELLARIDSPDVASSISNYQQAVADEILARKQLDRTKLLLDKGAYAVKDVEIAQDVDDKAKVTLATTEKQLRLLGGDPSNPSPIVGVLAPAPGYIVEQNIVAGTAVKSTDNSPNLFTIADLAHVWLICDVFENNLAGVHVGDSALVKLNAYPDRTLRGKVTNIGAVLDPITRAAKVRVELGNPGALLRIGMFAVATFRARTSQMRAFVPSAAVLRLHDRDWVFVPIGGRQFRRVEVQGGPVSPDGNQDVLAGVTPGQQVVAAALQFSSGSGQ